ncbi:MAG: tetratricopeptide repeat protein [Patescibacteria group bacterium]|nr:tetratricopeptide repeat protein [Patescibacteria group bacterium]
MDSININVHGQQHNPYVASTPTRQRRNPGFLNKLVKPLDYVLKAIIYFTIFALPLVFSPQTYDVLSLPKQTFLGIFVLVALILWMLKMVISRDFNIRRTPLDVPILIFGAIYLIASLVSISPLTSIIGFYGRLDGSFLTVLYFIILYYLITNNLRSKKEVMGVVLTLIMSTIVASIFAFMQMFGVYILPSDITKSKLFNTIGSLNALAVYIMAVIPITAALALRKDNEARISFAGTSVLLFVLLVLVNIKAAWWGILAASIVMIVMQFMDEKADKRWLAMPVLLGLLSLAFIFTANFGLNLQKEVPLDNKNSIAEVKQAIKERPVFGSGPETYAYDFSKFRAAEMNNQENWSFRYDKAHSDWLTNGATLGILGTIAYAFLIIMAAVTGFFNYQKARDGGMKYVTLGATAAVVGVGVMSLFYYSNFSLMLVFWVALALIGMARKSSEVTDDDVKDLNLKNASLEAKVFSTVFFALLFVGAFYGIYFAGKSYVADATYRKALLKTDKAENLLASEKLFKKAIDQNGYRETYRLSLSRVLLVEANLENQKSEKEKDIKKIQDYLSRAIDQGKLAVNTNPNSVSNWEGMIIIYRNAALYATGAIDWIEKSYQEALKLEPTNPVLVNGLGQVYLTKNDTDKAAEFFNKAIALKKDFADPHYNLALVYKDKKEYDKALEEMNIYLKAVPDSADAKTEIDNIKKLQENPNLTTEENQNLRGQPPAEAPTDNQSTNNTNN